MTALKTKFAILATSFSIFFLPVFFAGCLSEPPVEISKSKPTFPQKNTKTKTDLVYHNQVINKLSGTPNNEKKEYELIRNGDFSKGKTHWEFCRSSMTKANGQNVAEISQVSSEFKKIWQAMPLPITSGRKIRLSATMKVEAFDNENLAGMSRPKLYVAFLAEDRKTMLYAKDEKGYGLWTDPTDSKFKKRTVTFTIPKGTKFIHAAVCCGHPVKVQIREMSLTANLTQDEARSMGLLKTEKPIAIEGQSKRNAIDRAKNWVNANEIIPIIYPHTITIDGDSSDWNNVRFEGLLDTVQSTFVSPSDIYDCSGRFKVTADSDFLYVLVEMQDDILNFGKYSDYKDDSVEIYLSPLFRQETKYDLTDCQFTLIPKTPDLKEFDIVGRNFSRHFTPTAAGVRMENGWAVEVAIPLKNDLFIINPFDMLSLGFNVAYNDNDSNKGRDHKISWSKHDPDENAWQHPVVFGAAVFFTDKYMPIIPPRASGNDSFREETPTICNRNPGSINILRNGGFEADDLGWHTWYGNRAAFNLTTCTNPVFAGNHSMQIDGTAYKPGPISALLVSHHFNLIPGEKYRLRFAAKTDAKTPVSLIFRFKKPNYTSAQIGSFSLSQEDGWRTFEKSLVISEDFVKPNGPRDGLENVADLLIVCKNISANNIWFDNLEITRHIPGTVDGLIRFDSPLYAFANDENLIMHLDLHNPGTSAKNMTVKTEIRDQFYGTALFNTEVQTTAAANTVTTIDVPLKISRNGFFRIRTRICEDGVEECLVRETEIAVYTKPDSGTPLTGQCVSHTIYLNNTADDIVDALTRIKTKSVRIFIDREQEYAPGKYDFSNFERIVDKLNTADIQIIGCIRTADRLNYLPPYNLTEYERYVTALTKKLKGRVDIWEIGNEPNLWMGWKPKPDAREYDTVLRLAYNCIKREDPDSLVATAGFSGGTLIPDGYKSAFLEMDGGNFFDVFAFHPYFFESDNLWRQQMMDSIATIKGYCPNVRLMDTESGHDLKPVSVDMEVLAKKIPAFMYLGIDSHHEWGFDKTASGYIFGSYASSSPVYPLTAFLNVIYAKAKCLGALSLDDNFSGYLFKNTTGPFLVVWRETYDKNAVVTVPVKSAGKIYDVFGNDISSSFKRSGKEVTISLKNKLPVYIQNINTASLQVDIQKPPKYIKANLHREYETELLLLPAQLKGFFDMDAAVGEERNVALYLKNFSDKDHIVKLRTELSNSNVTANYLSPTVTVPARKSVPCPLKISAQKEGVCELLCAGEVNGRQLAPLPVNVSVSGGIRILPHGNTVVLKNISRNPVSGSLALTSKLVDVLPYTVDGLSLDPGKHKSIPLRIIPRIINNTKTYPENGLADVSALFTETDTKKETGSRLLIPLTEARLLTGETDVFQPDLFDHWIRSGTRLRLSKNGLGEETVAVIMLGYNSGHISVVARVKDTSPRQNATLGHIGSQDSLVIGIDANADTTSAGYQADDFEAGFALKNNNDILKYRWDGTYGLESARSFDEADVNIFRKDDYTFYNIKIPVSAVLKPKGTIGLALRITNLTAEGKLTVLTFAGGLGEQRDASLFGIVNLK